MHACWARIWIAASLFAAAAQGETLYQRDGIMLVGTVRMVTRGAGVCQVLAENHPPDVYEGMKGNHGQPLDVWQLDFAARNGSGRRLAYLTAHLKIESEWPPCTNWTGPEGRYAKTPQWAGSFETLQRVSGMEPGEQVSDTVYVLAFHSHEPRFENWQLDYRFAAGSVADPGEAVRGGVTSGRESGRAAAAAGLPPEIQVDLNLRKAEQALRSGDAAAAREAMELLEGLERGARAGAGSGGPLPLRAGLGGGRRAAAGGRGGGALPAGGGPRGGTLHRGAGSDQPCRGGGGSAGIRVCGGEPGWAGRTVRGAESQACRATSTACRRVAGVRRDGVRVGAGGGVPDGLDQSGSG